MTIPSWAPAWAVRAVVGALAGGLLYAAFPPRDLWFLAPLALAVLYGALRVGTPSIRSGALTGLTFGLGFFTPLLPWIGEYVGALPWIALAVVMALYTAAFGAIAVAVMRLRAAPLWFAVAWTGVEAIRSAFPFGGFPWGRAAFSQTSGLLLPVTSIVGVPGLSFVIALVGACLGALVLAVTGVVGRERAANRLPRMLAAPLAGLLAPVLAGAALSAVDAPGTHAVGERTVAAVQGNVPRLGLDFNEQRRAVLDNHVRQTLALGREVAAGTRPAPDLVLWPENASDIPPLDNPDAAELIRAAVSSVDAPIAVGTLMPNDGRPTNSVLLWGLRNGVADELPSGRYDKHIIQPFGEYLPWRGFFRMFSSYADRAGNFAPGTGPAVLSAQTASGPVELGVSTCWEVAFVRSPRQAVDDGAQLLYVPTNNATFGITDMSSQQLAMSRVRAVETGRDVAVAATSGLSALARSDGTVIEGSGLFEPALLQSTLTLREGRTPAVVLGPWPERILLLATVVAFLFALVRPTNLDVFAGREVTGRRDEGER